MICLSNLAIDPLLAVYPFKWIWPECYRPAATPCWDMQFSPFLSTSSCILSMYIPTYICICVFIFAQFAQVSCRADQQLHQLHKTTGLCRETRLIFSSDCSLLWLCGWFFSYCKIDAILFHFDLLMLEFYPELHMRSCCVHDVHFSMMYHCVHGVSLCSWCVNVFIVCTMYMCPWCGHVLIVCTCVQVVYMCSLFMVCTNRKSKWQIFSRCE